MFTVLCSNLFYYIRILFISWINPHTPSVFSQELLFTVKTSYVTCGIMKMAVILHSTISSGKQVTWTENLGRLHRLLCYSVHISRIPIWAELLPRRLLQHLCLATLLMFCFHELAASGSYGKGRSVAIEFLFRFGEDSVLWQMKRRAAAAPLLIQKPLINQRSCTSCSLYMLFSIPVLFLTSLNGQQTHCKSSQLEKPFQGSNRD